MSLGVYWQRGDIIQTLLARYILFLTTGISSPLSSGRKTRSRDIVDFRYLETSIISTMKKLLLLLLFTPLFSLGQMDYYVSANGGLNVREAPEAKAKKVSTLSYGTFVSIKSRTAIKLTINDTDKETGVTKVIEGEWVEIISENNIVGYVFDGYLEKISISWNIDKFSILYWWMNN